MLKNYFNNNHEIEIEIEKPVKTAQPLDSSNVNPNDLLRNYKDIKILPINPQQKKRVETLTQEIRTDLQHLKRIINSF